MYCASSYKNTFSHNSNRSDQLRGEPFVRWHRPCHTRENSCNRISAEKLQELEPVRVPAVARVRDKQLEDDAKSRVRQAGRQVGRQGNVEREREREAGRQEG